MSSSLDFEWGNNFIETLIDLARLEQWSVCIPCHNCPYPVYECTKPLHTYYIYIVDKNLSINWGSFQLVNIFKHTPTRTQTLCSFKTYTHTHTHAPHQCKVLYCSWQTQNMENMDSLDGSSNSNTNKYTRRMVNSIRNVRSIQFAWILVHTESPSLC